MTESKTEAINSLKKENYALKNRCKFLEDEVNRLKSVTLNLSTEMTATKMSKWNLSNPEELYEIENGIAERAALKRQLDYVNISGENKIRYLEGQLAMIGEILKGNNMVIHPIVGEQKTVSSLHDDVGGFGMFEESPVGSPNCYCQYE